MNIYFLSGVSSKLNPLSILLIATQRAMIFPPPPLLVIWPDMEPFRELSFSRKLWQENE